MAALGMQTQAGQCIWKWPLGVVVVHWAGFWALLHAYYLLQYHSCQACSSRRSLAKEAQWQAEREVLWKDIRLEVMQEILDDPASQVVSIHLLKLCLPRLPHMSPTEALTAGLAAVGWLTDSEHTFIAL